MAPNHYLFTGFERDAESALDHTWFRKYSPSQGRWCSADPLGGSIGNPQSLNRYAYVGNDPINRVDPLGLEACNLNIELEFSVDMSAADREAIQNRISAVLGQRTDAQGNNVTVSFNPGGQINASVTFKNSSWLNPFSWGRVGFSSLLFPPSVYVDQHRDSFAAFHLTDKLGNTAVHEMMHDLGVAILHSGDRNNVMHRSSGGGQLTEQQISDLFKHCKKLHPQRGNTVQIISGGGGGGAGSGGGGIGGGYGFGSDFFLGLLSRSLPPIQPSRRYPEFIVLP